MLRPLFLTIFSLMCLVANLQAHSHTHVSVNVGVGVGYHHGWYHDRVYVTDAWYHPSHVYVYNGDPYAVYYYGRPYYFFDPRFYYFQ